MVYVMSDIHGRYYKYLEMLEKINFNEKDFLFILGDAIDRGPNSIKILKHIKQNENIELLMGNHERMMLDSFQEDCHLNRDSFLWIESGGRSTFNEFDIESISFKKEILNDLNNLNHYKKMEINNRKFLLIHAGLDIPEKKQWSEEEIDHVLNSNIKQETNLWIREYFIDFDGCLGDYTVIFGHTPTSFIPSMIRYSKKLSTETIESCLKQKIFFGKQKIGIDCGENLGCLRLDDMVEFYIKGGSYE